MHFLIGKFIFASLIATFRHGREEDEVMGISFKKELVVDRVQVHPAEKEDEKSKLQVIYYYIGYTFFFVMSCIFLQEIFLETLFTSN